MTSKVKTLIIGIVVLVLLIAVLVVLKLTEPKEDTSSSENDSSVVTMEAIIEENLDNFKSFTVTNQYGSYSVKQEKTTTVDEETQEESTSYTYIINELEKFTQNESSISSMVSNINELYYNAKILEEIDDVSKYGLDSPSVVVEYEVTDKKYVVNIGNEAVDGTYYAMIDGDNSLYTINSNVANTVSKNSLEFLDTSLIPTETTSSEDTINTTPEITNLEIERPDLPSKIQIVPNDSTDTLVYSSAYKMVLPIESKISYTFDTDYIANIFGMSATGVEAIYDESKAGEYGFDNPNAIITIQYLDKTQKLIVGNKDEDGNYRVLLNDNGLVYIVSEETLLFMTVTADDIINSLVIAPTISDISTINVILNGTTYKYDLTNEMVENDEGEENLETTKVTYNSNELDLDNFRKYYQLLLSASVEKINYNKQTGTLIASIEYIYTDGGSDKIELYQGENRTMYVAINGDVKYEGRIAYFDKLVTETQNLLDGNTVDTEW